MLKKLTLVTVLIFALLATQVVSFAWTDIVTNTNFEGGVGLPWHVVEDYPAKAEFEIANNEYVIEVIDPGEAQWGIQFRHRQIPIESGMQYRVSFTVQASKSCKIYSKIGEMDGDYAEYWNNQWQSHELQANQWYTHEGEFTGNTNNPIAEWAFHLGDGEGTQYDKATVKAGTVIKFSKVTLQGKGFKPTPQPTPTPRKEIRVNQVGYYPNSQKVATLIGSASTWELKDSSGRTVKSGSTKSFGLDKDSGDTVQLIDFSDFTQEGTYYIEAGGESSYEFKIGNDIYSDLMYDALKYFYYNRSAQPIEAAYSHDPSFARAAGHTRDVAKCVEFAESRDTYGGTHSLDVTGGWYDAGDYGRYVVNGGIAAWTLMNQYERALAAGTADKYYGDNTMNIPESGNRIPDILDEVRPELEFMLKMQVPSNYKRAGMVHHKVHDDRWTALGLAPADDAERERVLKPPTTAATLNMAAAAAMGSRLFKDIDSSFANELISAAEVAWEAALANPSIYAPFTATMGGGPYGDDYVEDEFYWAAAELYITTGKSTYYDYIKKSKHFLEMPSELTGGEAKHGFIGAFDWGNTQGLGTISLLLNKDKLSSSEASTLESNIKKAADAWIDIQQKQGYGITIEQRPVFFDDPSLVGYPWGSNSFVINQCIVFAYAYDISNNAKYFNALTKAMDYIMGRNPNNQCYVSGYGSMPLTNPHHRWFAYQLDPSFPKAPPGWLSGGPNSGLQDPWVKGMGWKPGGFPPQKCFLDNIESWSTNEVTINWNAPLAWVTGYLTEIAEEGTPPIGDSNLGDLNGDGIINSLDATLMSRLILEMDGVEADKNVADINKDGRINSLDYSLLSRHILEIEFIK